MKFHDILMIFMIFEMFLEAPGYPFWRVLSRWPGSVPQVQGISFRSGGLLRIPGQNLSKTFQISSKYHHFHHFWEVLSSSRSIAPLSGVQISGFRQSRFQGVSKISPRSPFWALRSRSEDPDPEIQLLIIKIPTFWRGFWEVLSSSEQVRASSGWVGGVLPRDYPSGLEAFWSPFGWSWPEPLKNLSKYHHFHSSDLQNPSKSIQNLTKHQGSMRWGSSDFIVFDGFWPLFGPPFWEVFSGAFRCQEYCALHTGRGHAFLKNPSKKRSKMRYFLSSKTSPKVVQKRATFWTGFTDRVGELKVIV